MIRPFLSGCILMIALGAPAWAQDVCVAPAAPAIPNGTRATPTQIAAVQNDIKAFAAASDKFQSCLVQEIDRQKTVAKQNNLELDPGIQAALQAKGEAQRKDVGRIAAAWGATVDAFNKSQERKQRQPGLGSQAPGGGAYGGGTGY